MNCCAPQHVASLMDEIRKGSDKPIIVYPNSGERYDVEKRRWLGVSDSAGFAGASQDWRRAGASIIGGCCRTGPDHIRSIRASLHSPATQEMGRGARG